MTTRYAAPCRVCGGTITRVGASGPLPTLCPACRATRARGSRKAAAFTGECRDCGGSIEYSGRGRHPLRCDACAQVQQRLVARIWHQQHRQRSPLPRPGPCRDCGGEIVRGKRGPVRTQCSDCRRRHGPPLLPRPCDHCGSSFTPVPKAKNPRFCSAACGRDAWLAEAKRRYQARTEVREVVCVGCGDAFTAPISVAGPSAGPGSRRFHSRGCARRYAFRQRYGSGNYLQRPATSRKQRLVVFERDRWACGICHAVIDPALRWPHPGSATLDHIVPLADGGPHVPSNWQAAHAACNIEKGNLRRKRVAA